MTHAVLTPQAYASRYVKRCQRCRTVRGNSAFNPRHGALSDVCKFCTGNKRQIRGNLKRLTQLRATERRLAGELDDVRDEIQALESNPALREQAEMFEASA